MKKIIITGAGSGIGRACAIELSKNNDYSLILCGRRESELAVTRTLLANPEQHSVVKIDLSEPETLKAALEPHLKKKNLYAIVANAGIGGANLSGPENRWNEIIDTNLSGTYFLIDACLPHLKDSSHSWKHIVAVSSILGRIGVPHYQAYCASKSGLLGMIRSFATELASSHVLVNAICPGWVNTEMSDAGLKEISIATGRTVEEELKAQMQFVPLQKMAEPREIGALTSFLVSGAQTSITGQAIDINNGAWMG